MASKDNLLFLISICILYLNFLFISSQQTSGPNSTLVNDNEWKLVDKGYPIDEDGIKSQFYSIKEVDKTEWQFNKSFIEENRLNETQKFIFSFKLWLNYTSIYKPQVLVNVNDTERESMNPDNCPTQGFVSVISVWMQCEYEITYEELTVFKLIAIRTGDKSAIIAFKDFKIESVIQTKEKSCELDQSCIRNFYSYTCVGSDCYLFDTMLSDTNISNKNIPIIDDSIIPFYFTTSKDAKLKLAINFNDSFDACFQFNYQISQNSSLQISYNNFSAINLTETQVYEQNEWFPSESNPQKLCVRDLAKNIGNNFEIVLNAIINDTINQMIALRLINTNNGNVDELVEFIPIDEQLSELPYLTHWSIDNFNNEVDGMTDGDYTFENQWPLRLPQNNWDLNNDTLYFEGNSSLTSSATKQTSHMFSNWINKDVSVHKLRFIISNITSYENFHLKVFTFNEQMESNFIKTIDQNIVDKDGVVNIEIGKMETNFKIAFIVDYNSTNDVEFELKSVDMGDPCVEDDTTYNTCSNNGECERLDGNRYQCKCDSDQYTGDKCESYNYCYYNHSITTNGTQVYMNGTQFCESFGFGICINGGYTQFMCDCGADKFWNLNEYSCSNNLKCIEKQCDYKSHYCKEPKLSDEEAQCVCRPDGFVDIGGDCQQYDPCIQEHREALNQGEACTDPNANCVSYGVKVTDYTCVCNEGFKATGRLSNITCEPLNKCSFPTLNNCEQNCNQTINNNMFECWCEDLYELNNSVCELKNNSTCECGGNAFCGSSSTDCQCKLGYKFDNTTNACFPDLTFRAEQVCPYGNVTDKNNTIACYCGDRFQFSENNTCLLKHICGEGGDGRADCDLRSALCITDANDFGKYDCKCPPGKTFDDPLSENRICIDVCDFGNRSAICEEKNAKCNPILINATNVDLFCECNSGLIWSNDECVISLYSAQFNLSIKNIFRDDLFANDLDSILDSINDIYYFDLNGFVNELKSQNEQNLRYYQKSYNESKEAKLEHFLTIELTQIMKYTEYNVQNKNQIIVKGCQLNAEYYECAITVSLNNSFNTFSGNLSKNLGDLCTQVSNNSSDCFFQKIQESKNTYITTDSKVYSIVINRNILSDTDFKKYNNCESRTDICTPYKHSNCKESENSETSLYSCVCNDKYFRSVGSTPLPVQNGDTSAVEHMCIVKECDNNCPKANGSCYQSNPYKDSDNVWIAPQDCRCDNGFVLINSTTPNTCIGVCEGHNNCNSGKCVPKWADTYACVCDERWSGEHCENEFSYPLGGWIAGISVLALLLCVAVVLVFIYFRRSKKRDVSFNNNNQQLDDYSATSYRVGQQSGQNPYQGNINHAFNRD